MACYSAANCGMRSPHASCSLSFCGSIRCPGHSLRVKPQRIFTDRSQAAAGSAEQNRPRRARRSHRDRSPKRFGRGGERRSHCLSASLWRCAARAENAGQVRHALQHRLHQQAIHGFIRAAAAGRSEALARRSRSESTSRTSPGPTKLRFASCCRTLRDTRTTGRRTMFPRS